MSLPTEPKVVQGRVMLVGRVAQAGPLPRRQNQRMTTMMTMTMMMRRRMTTKMRMMTKQFMLRM